MLATPPSNPACAFQRHLHRLMKRGMGSLSQLSKTIDWQSRQPEKYPTLQYVAVLLFSHWLVAAAA
jgi:hypothetical protein